MSTLVACRHAIDQIDDEMAQLLNRRMALSEQVGKIKEATKRPTSDPRREAGND